MPSRAATFLRVAAPPLLPATERENRHMMAKTRDKQEALPGAVIPKVALSYDEAAYSIGISKAKLYRLVSEGRLPCVKIDGNTVLRPMDLEKFVEANVMTRGLPPRSKEER
jgi:excisionase family DNA binding protein